MQILLAIFNCTLNQCNLVSQKIINSLLLREDRERCGGNLLLK